MTPERHAHVCQEMQPAHIGDVGRTKCSARQQYPRLLIPQYMARAPLFPLTAGLIAGGEESGESSSSTVYSTVLNIIEQTSSIDLVDS